jgi:hypothetical protein
MTNTQERILMSTIVKDDFYVKYLGPTDEDLIKGQIYPIESLKVEKSYFGLGWPAIYFEFYPTLTSGLFDRAVGDENFIVVQADYWVEQELGYPKDGEVIEYMGCKFPWSGSEFSLPLMKMARRNKADW